MTEGDVIALFLLSVPVSLIIGWTGASMVEWLNAMIDRWL